MTACDGAHQTITTKTSNILSKGRIKYINENSCIRNSTQAREVFCPPSFVYTSFVQPPRPQSPLYTAHHITPSCPHSPNTPAPTSLLASVSLRTPRIRMKHIKSGQIHTLIQHHEPRPPRHPRWRAHRALPGRSSGNPLRTVE